MEAIRLFWVSVGIRFDVSNSHPTLKSGIPRRPSDRDVEDPVEDLVEDFLEEDADDLAKNGDDVKDVEDVEGDFEIDIEK